MSTKLRYAALASVAGFSLEHILDNKAHAYYPAASGAYLALATTTTTSYVGTTALVVLLVLKLAGVVDLEEDEEGDLARGLMESGLLNARADLGMELSLLIESPLAFEQMAQAMEEGEGAGLDSMSRTTGIPRAELAEHWTAASVAVGEVRDEATATLFVVDFLQRMGPSLQVGLEQRADFAWQLAVEQASPSSPDKAHAHKWLAQWMGVPVDSVLAASRSTLDSVKDDQPVRSTVQDDPEAFLRSLSVALEDEHKDQIQDRIRELVDEGSRWLPEVSAEAVASPT